MRKMKVSAEDKIYAVSLYLDGDKTQRNIASMFNVSTGSVRQWIRNYQSMGTEAFMSRKDRRYSKELKQQAVLDYLGGGGSLEEICKKYKIRSKPRLVDWIKKYNGHEELKSSRTGGNDIMTKGRKTTFDERIEIVQYCIAHNHNYGETSERFGISYQQARSYTIKYEQHGVESLHDRRGKRKPKEEMTEVDKLRAENRILRAEKEHAEMEMNFLKKLVEVERRRG